jgi:argininosuccinate synthase
MKKIKKIVLAYSGGLDTSVILKWLQDQYNAEVICYTSDLGQEINRKAIYQNAKKLGVKKIIIEDLKETFVKDYVFPMIRGNALYEGIYLLGTSIARPLIARRQVEIAKKYGAEAVSHGATGKGNDQVRFELGYYYFGPRIKVIAPWREWNLNSRSALIQYAKKNGIIVPKDKKGAPPFSVDDNLLHTSTEGKVLEDPKKPAPEYIFQRTSFS